MYTYSFETKQIGTIFDGITHFALLAGFQGKAVKGSNPEECIVLGNPAGKFYVGYPIALLGKVTIYGMYNSFQGELLINDCCIKYVTKVRYEIKGTTMYLTELS
jgi:hypothetical protein